MRAGARRHDTGFARALFAAACAAVLLVAGCVGTPQTETSRLDVRVEYVDASNQALEPALYPDDLVLEFGAVSGSIFGRPGKTPVLLTRVKNDLGFELDLQALERSLAALAAPLTIPPSYNRDLAIEPPGTQLVRLSTFPYSARTLQLLGGGGFIAPYSRRTLILIYTDRACTLRGDVNTGNTITTHRIRLPEKGLHWLQVRRTAANHGVLTPYHPRDGVVFSVHILDLEGV